MLFSSLVASALLASGAVAQFDYALGGGSDSGSESMSSMAPSSTGGAEIMSGSSDMGSTPPGMVSVQVVQVSNNEGTLKFYPDDIKAEAGSMVQFQFHPKNHSVVQSAFSDPCSPINTVMSNVTGFKSGFMPVSADSTDMPVFTIMVNDTEPIWFYCSQKPHCSKGMVGVINAPGGDKTIDSFRSLAMAGGDMNGTTTSDGYGSTPTEGSETGSETATATETESVAGSTDSEEPPQQTTNSGARLAGSASLAGVAIAGFLLLL